MAAATAPSRAIPDRVSPRRRTVWIGVGAVLAVVVLVVGITLIVLPGLSDRAAPATAEQAVRDYLHALARADAGAARELVDVSRVAATPASAGLVLGDESLRRQREAGALTDIAVHADASSQAPATHSSGSAASASGSSNSSSARPASGDSTVKVGADFRIGGKSVSTTYSVTDRSGRWIIENGLAEVTVATTAIPGVNLLGVPVSGGTAVMFPGALQWGSTSRYLRVVGSADEAPGGSASPLHVTLRAELNDAGAQAVRDAMNRYLHGCASSTQVDASSDRPGCVQRLYRSATAGSVRWTAPTSQDDLVTDVKQDHPLTVSVFGSVDWNARFTATYGGEHKAVVDQVMDGSVDLTTTPPKYTAAP